MLVKWLDNYKRLAIRTRFISQLADFLISVFCVLSFGYFLLGVYKTPEYLSYSDGVEALMESFAFHSIVLVFFAGRFLLLSARPNRFFWLSELLWAMSLAVLLTYGVITRGSLYHFFYYDGPPYDYLAVFRNTTNAFQLTAGFYLFISPLRHLVTLIISKFQ